MTLYTVDLHGPSIDFTPPTNDGFAVGRYACLEDWALEYESLPADTTIIESSVWSEGPDYPAGSSGNFGWAVDRGIYRQLTAPPPERCQPFALTRLAPLWLAPGSSGGQQTSRWLHPEGIPYLPGYRIILSPEVWGMGGRLVSLFPMVRVKSDLGFVPKTGLVWRNLLNQSPPKGQAPLSFRSLISGIPAGGNRVVVTIQSLWNGATFSHMSIGVRSGTSGYNMAAAPVPLTFDGNAGMTLGPDDRRRSAPAVLTTTPGCDLLIHCCVSDSWGYKDGCIDGSVWQPGVVGHDQANFSGSNANNATRCQMVAAVEVFTV